MLPEILDLIQSNPLLEDTHGMVEADAVAPRYSPETDATSSLPIQPAYIPPVLPPQLPRLQQPKQFHPKRPLLTNPPQLQQTNITNVYPQPSSSHVVAEEDVHAFENEVAFFNTLQRPKGFNLDSLPSSTTSTSNNNNKNVNPICKLNSSNSGSQEKLKNSQRSFSSLLDGLLSDELEKDVVPKKHGELELALNSDKGSVHSSSSVGMMDDDESNLQCLSLAVFEKNDHEQIEQSFHCDDDLLLKEIEGCFF